MAAVVLVAALTASSQAAYFEPGEVPAKAAAERVVVCETRRQYNTLMDSYGAGDWHETWESLVQWQRVCTLVPKGTLVDILVYTADERSKEATSLPRIGFRGDT